MLLDELEQGRIDRGPDRACRRLVARRHLDPVGQHGLGEGRIGARLAHVLERDHDLEVELLAGPCVDKLDRTAARHEATDLLERALGRREPDALERLIGDLGEAFQRDREVRATFRARDRVHLVDDHRLDASQHLAALGGEEEKQRLGRRDQDVGRRTQHLTALPLIGVPGADAHAQSRAEAGERPAEVPLDVVVERLQRRDVEQSQALAGTGVQPIDAGQECGKGLPRAGRVPGPARGSRSRSPARLLPAQASALRTPARTTSAWRG